MSRKQMMITGSNRGLGAACVAEFSGDYDLITVSRHPGSTEVGDLSDTAFLNHLVEAHNPDVLINNAGLYSDDIAEQIDINFTQAVHLMTGFYDKMRPGSIIVNVCSRSANLIGWPNIETKEATYIAAKSGLKKMSNVLSRSKKRAVRVTSLEPASMITDFADVKQRWERIKDNIPKNHMWYRQQPMEPSYVAQTIRWIIDQPLHVEITSIEILNSITP